MENAPAPVTNPAKLAEEFMAEFTSNRQNLKEAIDEITPNNENLGDKLTQISNEIQKLSKTLHDAVLYLPSYSVKVRQSEIRELEKCLKLKEDEMIPKKRFGFKAKPALNSNSSSDINTEEKKVEESKPVNGNVKVSADTNNFVTIENLENTTVVFDNSRVSKTDVLVRNLSNVVLHLHGSPSTLRINNVKNCKILCGPVHTSVFVESAFDCILFICCQQLRTHNSKDTDIYLRVRSRAIIEECSGIRFAPYLWDHPSSRELHESAQIDPDMERFDVVDDFNWLSTSPSPNWSILPSEQRISFPSV